MNKSTYNIDIIVAKNYFSGGIGIKGRIPWDLKEDRKRFRDITRFTTDKNKRNAVVMGRKTWESLPGTLPGRDNIVISSTMKKQENADYKVFGTIDDFLLHIPEHIETVFVIGGARIYEEFLTRYIRYIYSTDVFYNFECDVYYPEEPFSKRVVFDSGFKFYNGISYKFTVYTPDHEEYQYLDLIHKIIEKGVEKPDRTGVGTYSLFGEMMRFNLRNHFPLFTTKRVFWKGIVEELIWFIKGETNSKLLSEKGVKIWEGNSSREFLDKRGLFHLKEGELGPVYGFQWRHFGQEYKGSDYDYSYLGYDQLATAIETIKKNPNSRRILVSAWNPQDLNKMALPPCHVMFQFYVSKGELSCSMYQRSCDMGLGVPFNVASYALLTYIIARHCGLKPGDFVYSMGDVHIYKNHLESLKEQIKRVPRPFPSVKISKEESIDAYTKENIELIGYNPLGKIKMKMAV